MKYQFSFGILNTEIYTALERKFIFNVSCHVSLHPGGTES